MRSVITETYSEPSRVDVFGMRVWQDKYGEPTRIVTKAGVDVTVLSENDRMIAAITDELVEKLTACIDADIIRAVMQITSNERET